MTQRLVVLGGIGDVYLVAALYRSFQDEHPLEKIMLVIRGKYAPLVDLFDGVPYVVDDIAVATGEASQEFHRRYDNDLFEGRNFYPHPCMARTPIKLDEFPARWFVTHADMYRAILGLPLDAPVSLPRVPKGETVPNSVMIVQATTWPNTQPTFYPKLEAALRASGRDVWTNDPATSLEQLFKRLASAEWVIGPQCGLMSLIVAGRWPCRKTLATPDIDGGRAPHYWAKTTFPYAYTSRFVGEEHDVEELKITDNNHEEIITGIITGSNALRTRPHDPRPVTAIPMALTAGDLLDRFAVLIVKNSKFEGAKRADVRRELARYGEACREISKLAAEEFTDLLLLHMETFNLLESAVPHALNGGGMDPSEHVAAIKLNKKRVELKRAIDAKVGAPYAEIKSYYGAA